MGVKRIYDIDDYFFDVIDTQDKAYIFGLFYADATNYEDKGVIKIDLQDTDEELLLKIKDVMKYTGKLKHYEQEDKCFNGKIYEAKDQVRFQFSSHRISEQLAEKGCVHNKSAVAMFPKKDIIPENLMKHFIRGYIDGNGGTSYWIDNERTGHKKFQINCCGTTDIINNLAKILGDKFDCYPAISDRFPDRDNNNLQFNICGNNKVRAVLDWLYDDANIYMKRKYDKYLELIEENKRVASDTTLYGSAHPRRPVINLETKEIYPSMSAAAKAFGVKTSTIFGWCKKHKGFMYLDEYEELYGKISD